MKLKLLKKIVKEQGYAGSTDVVQLAYLSLFSSACGKPVSLLIKGSSGAGKSFALNKAKQFIPVEAFEEFEGMSEKAIVYLKDLSLKNKHLIIGEAAGMASGNGRTLLRQLLSEGKVRYATVDTSNGVEGKTLPIIEGPTGLIMTTTASNLHNEDESRMLSVNIKETPEAIREVLMAQALGISTSVKREHDMSEWHELYKKVKELELEVQIPFAQEIAKRLPLTAEKVKRDFPQLLVLLKTHALMHYEEREVIDGKIQVTLEDYAVVRALVNVPMSEGLSQTVPLNIREVVEGVKQLSSNGYAGRLSHSRLAEHLGKDQSVVSRSVKKAIADGYLDDDNFGQGRKSNLSEGDRKLPSKTILPSVEEIIGKTENFSKSMDLPNLPELGSDFRQKEAVKRPW